ncbi:nucleotidyltransferase family protein [Elusimicrobiota bacterium]
MEISLFLNDLVAKIADSADPDRIILFGSRARGDARDRSDIDIGIDVQAMTGKQWSQISEIIEDAPTLLSIDIVRLQEIGPRMRENIAKEGVILYERKPS